MYQERIMLSSEDILNKIKQYNAKETKIEEEHKIKMGLSKKKRISK